MTIIDCTPAISIAYAHDGEQYHIFTDYKRTADGGSTYTIAATSANPLIVWTAYWQMVDSAMRRRIGAALEKQGCSPYTGAPAAAFPSEPPNNEGSE